MEIALGLGPTPPGPFPPKWGHVTHRPALPDLQDVQQVGRAPEILQIWTLLATNPPAQLHFQGFAEFARPAGRPAGRAGHHWMSGRSGRAPLDVRQVGQGPTRKEGPERVKKSRKIKVLSMKSSIVENVPTPRESLLELFPASQLPYRAQIQKILKISKI